MQQLTETNAIARRVNHGLMVAWINHRLIERAGHDVRTSVVLYDEDKLFEQCLPDDWPYGEDLNNLPQEVQERLHDAGIHYWSKGIV